MQASRRFGSDVRVRLEAVSVERVAKAFALTGYRSRAVQASQRDQLQYEAFRGNKVRRACGPMD
jgi:hypothetical protein